MRVRLWSVLSCMLLLAAAVGALGASGAAPVEQVTQATPPPEAPEALPAGTSIQTVVPNLDRPVAMAFDQAGRMFITEKGGRVRLFANGTLQVAPVISFNVDPTHERGLLGITLDPNFSSNHYVYVFYTEMPASATSDRVNKVVRFTENNGLGSNPTEIFASPDSVGTTNHNGGNIHFGPDGKLYISVGDDARPDTAQDVTVKNGKIHRVNPDGSPAQGNPVFTQTGALPTLYARGLRNTFDFAFDPANGTVWASENGPECDDELNRILPGGNYGWRSGYLCQDANPSPTYNTIPPAWWLPSGACCEAPTGVEFYTGNQIAAWSNGLFMCAYAGGKLRHMHLDAGRTQITSVGVVQGVNCQMDIQTGPDGALYYMEGGGYSPGTIKRIVGPATTSTPTRTATQVPPTATATQVPPTATATQVPPTATASATGTPPTPVPTATTCSMSFGDVLPADYFYVPVRYLYCAGVISGYADGTFRPYNTTTRGQVAKIVVLAQGWPLLNPATPTFLDVQPSNPFYREIETAVQRGVISGYDVPGGREFRWGNSVTRGQLAKIVVGAEGWPLDTTGAPHFADVLPDNPFFAFVETAYNRGIISGYEDGTFRWGNSATRGQIAKIVYEALQR